MKLGFFGRLAWGNVWKNHRLYIPSILTGAGLNAVFYIILTLARDECLGGVRGGTYLRDLMPMGMLVVAFLSFILILYTNSFIIRQRKREFGLYNILGMEKRHVGRILFWETVFAGGLAVLLGTMGGVVFYKLCALIICRILKVESVLGFYYLSSATLIPSALYFCGLYLLTCIVNRISIARMKPVELLQSASTGEREPKTKLLLLIVGILTLGGGYSISVTTTQPLKALSLFFVAVLLVIVGTYCLFLAGTIAILKLLKGNKRYYYQKNHMIAVSGLLYRMKQNAVGLASISIMATMVLVMMSTTVSLYAGTENTLENQYPHQLYLNAGYTSGDTYKELSNDELLPFVEETASELGLSITYHGTQRYLICGFGLQGEKLLTEVDEELTGGVVECFFMTAADYEAMTGEHLELSGNDIALCALPSNTGTAPAAFQLDELTLTPTIQLKYFPVGMEAYALVDCYGFVVSSEEVLREINTIQHNGYGERASEIAESLVIDFSDREAAGEVYTDIEDTLRAKLTDHFQQDPDYNGEGMATKSYWDARAYLYGMFGTLLFLGLILSFAFLFSTALVIYYKQISEGYEDRARFQIMQKVGMSEEETKAAIQTQVLLVFLLPLLVAGLHITFAFPMLLRLMRILFHNGFWMFVGSAAGSFLCFALIYLVIYRMTARTYYHIVR